MLAAVWHNRRDLRVEEVEKPRPRDGEVLVKVSRAGICGTDIHEYAAGPVFIPLKPHRVTGRKAPLVLGHEFAGVIEKVGGGVGGWKPGDRVTASGNYVCHECRWCRSGRENLCENLAFNGIGRDGCFAEYTVVPAYQLYRVPDNVTLEHAPLSEPLACGAHATGIVERMIGPVRGMTVAVVGSGMIGMSCLIAARVAGASRLVMFGVGTAKADVARGLGADEYVDVAAVAPVAFVQEWCPGGVDLAFECVGNPAAISSAVKVTRKAGAVMMMGVYEEEPRVPLNTFGEREQVMLSSQAYADEIGVALRWMADGLVDADRLITARVPLRDIAERGFEEILRNRDRHIKVIVEID